MRLNIFSLNAVRLNIIGDFVRKKNRYIPDDKVPNTYVEFYGADNEPLYGSDENKFYGKI